MREQAQHDELLMAMGLTRAQHVAEQLETLATHGTRTLVARRPWDGRILGFLSVAPDPWPTACLGQPIWSVPLVALGPDAPPETACLLASAAVKLVQAEAATGYITIRSPATDGAVVAGLHAAGFRPLVGELSWVAECRWVIAPSGVGGRFEPAAEADLLDMADFCFGLQPYGHLEQETGFDQARVSGLGPRLLRSYLQEEDKLALVCRDSHGRPQALLAGRRLGPTCCGEANNLLRLDFLAQRHGLEDGRQPLRHEWQVLAALRHHGIDKVFFQAAINDTILRLWGDERRTRPILASATGLIFRRRLG